MLTIDPNVIYRMRTSEGELMENDSPNDEAVDNLKNLDINILDSIRILRLFKFVGNIF